MQQCQSINVSSAGMPRKLGRGAAGGLGIGGDHSNFPSRWHGCTLLPVNLD